MSCNSIDAAARQLIDNSGYAGCFGHSTGHGVGLEIHEKPNISPKNEQITENNMLFTIEPGIYLEGKFGIRTENLMLCVKDVKNEFGQFMKFENLTWVPIDLDTIDISLMEARDRELLNAYHKGVYEKLSPYMTEEEKMWLADQ